MSLLFTYIEKVAKSEIIVHNILNFILQGQMEVTPVMYAHFVSLLSSLACGKMCLILEVS